MLKFTFYSLKNLFCLYINKGWRFLSILCEGKGKREGIVLKQRCDVLITSVRLLK